jgi:hypothetical protein
MARSPPRRPRHLLGAGGCDFADADDATAASAIVWTARVLPTVTTLSGTSSAIADSALSLPSERLSALRAHEAGPLLIEVSGALLRAEKLDTLRDDIAVTLPLDRLFDIRVAAALRLWRALSGRKPGPDPAALSQARLRRLSLGLRALDGRSRNASYREVAEVLFEARQLEPTQWKTHSLRDQTIRLVRYGMAMMRGRYRLLLLHPYRRRS